MTTPVPTILGDTALAATDDPVRALLGAVQQGLLDYVGYTDLDLYEVRLAGVPRQLPAAAVLPMVRQLRSVRRLRDSGVPVELVEVGDGPGPFRISTGHALHDVPHGQLVDWVDGHLAAKQRTSRDHAKSRIGEIRRVLEDPGLSDQARLVVLGLMYGDPEHETSMEELAEKVDRSKKTVIEALSFGKHLMPELADRMIEAFGRRWRLTADGVKDLTDAVGQPVGPPVDMPGIARLRMINAAERKGLLRYVGEASPNKARWLRSYALSVGGSSYTVSAESLPGWLAGLEAWHAQAALASEGKA